MTSCGAFAPTTAARAALSERLRDWTDRAAGSYRDGLKVLNAGDMRRAREYGAAAHDLARPSTTPATPSAIDRPDPDLPPPSDDFGLEDTRERARRDLYRAYERLGWLGDLATACGIGVLRQGGARPLQRGPARPGGRPRRARRRAGPRRGGDDPRARTPRPGGRRAGRVLGSARPAFAARSGPIPRKGRSRAARLPRADVLRRRCRPAERDNR